MLSRVRCYEGVQQSVPRWRTSLHRLTPLYPKRMLYRLWWHERLKSQEIPLIADQLHRPQDHPPISRILQAIRHSVHWSQSVLRYTMIISKITLASSLFEDLLNNSVLQHYYLPSRTFAFLRGANASYRCGYVLEHRMAL